VTWPAPALLLSLWLTPAHPLHTTLTTVDWRADRRQLQVAVRVFSQDLGLAVTRSRNAALRNDAVPDSTACRYALGMLTIRDAAGRPLGPAGCTAQRAADLTWIRLEIPAPEPAGLSVLSTFLFELFPDQINIVQATLPGRTRTILFTRGDGPKPLA
jgi:hypothetical protein